MGEGAGILVFEELDHAKRRGARIYGEVIGFGMTADAYHISEPDPDGKALIKALKDTLEMASIPPGRSGLYQCSRDLHPTERQH